MKIFKIIWAWLVGTKKQDKEACARNFEKEYEKKYNTGGFAEYKAPELRCSNMDYVPKPAPQNPARDFSREADDYLRQQARRNSDDNFMLGTLAGYVVADSLNDNTSHRNVEETKSSSYESSYTPSSSSSYDSGSYSSSSDSGSSSFSCDSGGC